MGGFVDGIFLVLMGDGFWSVGVGFGFLFCFFVCLFVYGLFWFLVLGRKFSYNICRSKALCRRLHKYHFSLKQFHLVQLR